MAFIKRNGIWRPNQFPNARFVLNRDDPITQAIVDDYVFYGGNGPPINVSNPGNIATLTGGPGYKSSPGGVGGYGTGGNYFSLPSSDFAANGNTGWTLRIRFMSVSSTGGFMAIADTTNRKPGLFLGAGGAASFGGAYGISFAGTYPIGTVCEVVFVGTAGTPFTGHCYANGVLVGTAASWTASSAETLVLGNNISTGGSHPDTIYLEYTTWTRGLTASEVARLYAEQFATLRPADTRRFYLLPSVSGGAGNPTFSIAGTVTTGQVSASLIAMAGVGALNPKAASLFAAPGLGIVNAISASLYGMAGAVTTAFTSASIFGIAGTGAFSPIPLGSAAFAITGAGAFNPRSATQFSITGIGAFSPVPPAAGVAFTMTGLATVTFIGRSTGWTPVTPITAIWTPTIDATQIWTPVTPGSPNWNPQ